MKITESLKAKLDNAASNEEVKKILDETKKGVEGAGIILDMPLNSQKTLRSLTVSTLSNDVVIGLMGITLQRPANISMQKK